MRKNSLKAAPSSLRPIGARALKSAIDTLRPHLQGASILDLFAGQGRFSYAALWEGAKSSVMIEKHKDTARRLSALRPKKIPLERTHQVICQDVWTFLEKPPTDLYDIIFVDPPFEDWNLELEKNIFKSVVPFCRVGTILLVKYPSQMLISNDYPGFRLWKLNQFGEATLAYFSYGEA